MENDKRRDKISEYEHRQRIKEQQLKGMGYRFHDEHIFDSTSLDGGIMTGIVLLGIFEIGTAQDIDRNLFRCEK